MKVILYLFVAVFALAACTSKTDGIDAKAFEPRSLFPAGQQSELLQQIAPAPQQFTVSVKTDTAIVCKNGTVISLPQECFIDEDGNVFTENIKIEVVEAQTFGDMLRYNLQTVSNGRVLQTGGMLYIDAKAGDKSLALQKDAALYVELPASARASGMKLFTGAYDSTGNVNWNEAGELEEGLTPMPLEEFDYTFCRRYGYDERVDPYTHHCQDSLVLHTNKAYENTYIATPDFEQRFAYTRYNWWWAWDEEYKVSKDGRKYSYKMDDTVLNFYLTNTDKPLWYADSLAYVFIKKKEHDDSIKHKELYGEGFLYPQYTQFFKAMYDQRIGKVKKFDARGVELSKANAKELLVQKGYTPEQAADQLRMFRAREKFSVERRALKKAKQEAKEREERVQKLFSNAFKVNKLGWVNVDRFMDDPQAKEVELFVEIKGDSLPACDVTLVITAQSIAMNGIHMGGNKYRFTKAEKMYSKLPVGAFAYVIVMGSKNKQPYYAEQKIVIQEKQNLVLTPKKSSWKEIEATLAAADKMR